MKIPRTYQQDIINKTLSTNKSTLIQLPTGGGKTIIAKEIAIELINKQNKKILFVAPKIVLMEQTLEQFKYLKPQKIHGTNKFGGMLCQFSQRVQKQPEKLDEVHFVVKFN